MGTVVKGQEARKTIAFSDNRHLVQLFGPGECNLRMLEQELDLQVHSRGGEVTLVGEVEQVDLAARLLRQLHAMASRGRKVDAEDYRRGVRVLRQDGGSSVKKALGSSVLVTSAGRSIAPKGMAQQRYVEAFNSHDIVFGIGPAGTGKTYLAMAMAVSALNRQKVKRIVLTRPAVEAGEKLGFLPGDLVEKVNPYLRPLYDALHDMMDMDRVEAMLDRGTIEVAPLAFMRGRTLNSAFVILDEAQNTTSEQMLMFLTRLGFDSQAVVTGDITQVDLPGGCRSGLREAQDLLADIEGIRFCRFTDKDVVRHPLVQKIIKAYEKRGDDGGDGDKVQ